MFDRAIIDTDRFMDLPISAKAVYFLLGMEADDEGFVSYKKVLRIHGGNDDDVKILTAKNFLIVFDSGVVVITDWNRNNWLDARRVRETEYQKEKKQILLTDMDRYELSNGLAGARQPLRENSIEQSSIEENRTVESEDTPSQIAKDFFDKGKRYNEVFEALSVKVPKDVLERELNKFILYWTEPNKSGTKVRWQQESTFEIKRRIATWLNRVSEYRKPKAKQIIY